MRTTNTMWLAPPVSVRVNRAMYTPDTAVDGTTHDADTAQFPQSTGAGDAVAFGSSRRPAASAA